MQITKDKIKYYICSPNDGEVAQQVRAHDS